jgi:hypothetical protein
MICIWHDRVRFVRVPAGFQRAQNDLTGATSSGDVRPISNPRLKGVWWRGRGQDFAFFHSISADVWLTAAVVWSLPHLQGAAASIPLSALIVVADGMSSDRPACVLFRQSPPRGLGRRLFIFSARCCAHEAFYPFGFKSYCWFSLFPPFWLSRRWTLEADAWVMRASRTRFSGCCDDQPRSLLDGKFCAIFEETGA